MRLLAAQEPIQASFFQLRKAPRALQEAPKRLSDAFRVEDAIRSPFWTDFGLQNEPLGPYKARNFVIHSSNFKVLHVSARIAFGPRFGLLLGLFRGAAETNLLGALGPAKSRFRVVFFGPKGVQERSKRHPGGKTPPGQIS